MTALIICLLPFVAVAVFLVISWVGQWTEELGIVAALGVIIFGAIQAEHVGQPSDLINVVAIFATGAGLLASDIWSFKPLYRWNRQSIQECWLKRHRPAS